MSTLGDTKIVSVLMPLDLVAALEAQAKAHERTLSQEIRLALKAHVAELEEAA